LSDVWATVLALALASAAIRASGPVLLGGRELPEWIRRPIALVAPALLAALIVVGTFTGDEGVLELDARAAGLAAAGGFLALTRGSMVVAVAVAALVAALVRLAS